MAVTEIIGSFPPGAVKTNVPLLLILWRRKYSRDNSEMQVFAPSLEVAKEYALKQAEPDDKIVIRAQRRDSTFRTLSVRIHGDGETWHDRPFNLKRMRWVNENFPEYILQRSLTAANARTFSVTPL